MSDAYYFTIRCRHLSPERRSVYFDVACIEASKAEFALNYARSFVRFELGLDVDEWQFSVTESQPLTDIREPHGTQSGPGCA